MHIYIDSFGKDNLWSKKPYPHHMCLSHNVLFNQFATTHSYLIDETWGSVLTIALSLNNSFIIEVEHCNSLDSIN